jgi:hypothetical protein
MELSPFFKPTMMMQLQPAYKFIYLYPVHKQCDTNNNNDIMLEMAINASLDVQEATILLR